MAEYVASSNPYKSLVFMLCCDDTVRENGSDEKADRMYAICGQFGRVPVAMKNDWTAICGENVSRKTNESFREAGLKRFCFFHSS
jgi:hypothetical protein